MQDPDRMIRMLRVESGNQSFGVSCVGHQDLGVGVGLIVIVPGVNMAFLRGLQAFDIGKEIQGGMGTELAPERILRIPAHVSLQIEFAACIQIGIEQAVIQRIWIQDIGRVAPAEEAEDGFKLVDVVIVGDQLIGIDYIEMCHLVEGIDDRQTIMVPGLIDQDLALCVVLLANIAHGRISVIEIGVDILQFRPDDASGVHGIAEEIKLGVREIGKGERGAAGLPIAGEVFQPVQVVGTEPAPAGIAPAEFVPSGAGGAHGGHGFLLQGVFREALLVVVDHAVVAGSCEEDESVLIGQIVKALAADHVHPGHFPGIGQAVLVVIVHPDFSGRGGCRAVCAPVQDTVTLRTEQVFQAVIVQGVIRRIGRQIAGLLVHGGALPVAEHGGAGIFHEGSAVGLQIHRFRLSAVVEIGGWQQGTAFPRSGSLLVCHGARGDLRGDGGAVGGDAADKELRSEIAEIVLEAKTG